MAPREFVAASLRAFRPDRDGEGGRVIFVGGRKPDLARPYEAQ
jgi:hypothetical protein